MLCASEEKIVVTARGSLPEELWLSADLPSPSTPSLELDVVLVLDIKQREILRQILAHALREVRLSFLLLERDEVGLCAFDRRRRCFNWLQGAHDCCGCVDVF